MQELFFVATVNVLSVRSIHSVCDQHHLVWFEGVNNECSGKL